MSKIEPTPAPSTKPEEKHPLKIEGSTNSGIVVKKSRNCFVRSIKGKSYKTIPKPLISALNKSMKIVESAGGWRIEGEELTKGSQYIYRTPLSPQDLPKWRHLNPKAKFMFQGFATMGLEKETGFNLMAITINISPARAKQAIHSNRPMKTLAPALMKILTKHLNRRPDIAMVAEMRIGGEDSDLGRLHLHGMALLQSHEEKAFREAVRDFNSDLTGVPDPKVFRRNQLVMKPMTGMGWAVYSTKDTSHTRRFGFQLRDILYSTRDITKKAHEIFTELKNETNRLSEVPHRAITTPAAPAKAADRSGSVLSIANHSTTQNHSNTSSSASRRPALLSA
ncbi:MAG: hypothetical protein HQL72_15740, partial [Magnetococcales bacterium]|nr:hypothetical protein [Magnetococcales bacterium]